MSVFLVTAATRTAANMAAGEQMFQRAVPFDSQTPTHYVAGLANIPANIKTAILAAGAVEYDTLDAAMLAAGISPSKTAEEKLADARTALTAVSAIEAPVLTADVLDVLTDLAAALED